MKYTKILTDILFGALILGIGSYMNELYRDSNDLPRIYAFLWTFPLIYIFFINLFKDRGKNAIIEFNKHALLGTTLTIIIILTTSYFIDLPIIYLMYANISVLIIALFIYFKFKIYKVGTV